MRVPIWIKKGLFEFPSDQSAPVIMFGPGTGCAPFRAFIQEAVAQGRQGLFTTTIDSSSFKSLKLFKIIILILMTLLNALEIHRTSSASVI